MEPVPAIRPLWLVLKHSPRALIRHSKPLNQIWPLSKPPLLLLRPLLPSSENVSSEVVLSLPSLILSPMLVPPVLSTLPPHSEPLILMFMLLMVLEELPRVPDNWPLTNSPLPLAQSLPNLPQELAMLEPSWRLEQVHNLHGPMQFRLSLMHKVPSPLPWELMTLPPSDKLLRMTPPPGPPRTMPLTVKSRMSLTLIMP